MAVGQSSRARPSATMDDGARPPLDMNMVMMMMMHQYLAPSFDGGRSRGGVRHRVSEIVTATARN
jgi:hypothetical protein